MRWVDELIDGKPDSDTAIIDHDGSILSYEALRTEITRATQRLIAQGVEPGDRVLIVAENCAQLAIGFLATTRLRAWCIPVNARVTANELDAIRSHATPRVTLFTTAVSPDAQAHADRLGATQQEPDWTTLTDSTVVPEPVFDTPAQQVAAMVYTSGTTGAPKGVMLSHQSLVFNATVSARTRHFAPGDTLILTLPCTHIMALSTSLLAGLSGGATIRFLARFSVDAQLRALAEGGTVMSVVPQIFDQLLRKLDADNAALTAPRLRMIGCGGAPLDPALKARVEARFGLTLQNGYGLTEAGPGVTSTIYGPPRSDGSIGYVYPECAVQIDAPDRDGAGELLFRGPGVMLGYYRNPQATAEVMTETGYLRTGDLARIDPDGALHLVGRKKELIVRSGFNIYPPEVEAALMSCPGVLQAAVVGRTHAGNEEVLAFVTSNGSTDTATIAAHLRQHLAPYKQPQHITIVAAMPMTSAGKIRKPALVEGFAP